MKVVRQKTIKNPISCTGIGLHSGVNTTMTLRPAPPGTGIVFVRIDRGGAVIPARYDRVCDAALGTTLTDDRGVTVATVEHLMAALWGAEIDNLHIDLDGPEVPAMDGSAAPFLFLLECAGIAEQASPRQAIRLCRPIAVSDDGKRIALEPAGSFSITFAIEFANPVVACQEFRFRSAPGAFKSELGRARTFGFIDEVAALHAAGFARGGSLDNAVVVGEDRVLNEEGLRYDDEFVRHKVLDCIGDLYLTGAPLLADVTANCSGHELNNALLRALFTDEANWRVTPLRETPATWPAVAAAAAGG